MSVYTIDTEGAISAVTANAEVDMFDKDGTARVKKATATQIATYVWSGGGTLTDGSNLVLGTTTGSEIGTSVSQKLGFYGTTPAVQPTSANEAAVTVNTITTASTTTSPAGYATTTQANNIATELAAVVVLANQLRADLVTLGLIKGA
jgi:hypothetical protein